MTDKYVPKKGDIIRDSRGQKFIIDELDEHYVFDIDLNVEIPIPETELECVGLSLERIKANRKKLKEKLLKPYRDDASYVVYYVKDIRWFIEKAFKEVD